MMIATPIKLAEALRAVLNSEVVKHAPMNTYSEAILNATQLLEAYDFENFVNGHVCDALCSTESHIRLGREITLRPDARTNPPDVIKRS